jgi:hypothetical protein
MFGNHVISRLILLPFEEVERKDSDFSSNRIPSPRRNRQSKTKVELSQQFFMEISIAKNLTFNLLESTNIVGRAKFNTRQLSS